MNRSRYYREVRRIRRVEEEIARIYPSDKIMSPIHLSMGPQEEASEITQLKGPFR
jgi:TPP-dependent pyruvate/acetoin dehydrogenase alpha subunit